MDIENKFIKLGVQVPLESIADALINGSPLDIINNKIYCYKMMMNSLGEEFKINYNIEVILMGVN